MVDQPEAFNRLVLAYQDMIFNQTYRMLGDQDAAHAAARRLRDLRPESKSASQGVHAANDRAQILAWAGDKTTAISEVARLLRKPGGPNVHELRHSLFWFPLRGDPRFEALLNDPKNNAPLF